MKHKPKDRECGGRVTEELDSGHYDYGEGVGWYDLELVCEHCGPVKESEVERMSECPKCGKWTANITAWGGGENLLSRKGSCEHCGQTFEAVSKRDPITKKWKREVRKI